VDACHPDRALGAWEVARGVLLVQCASGRRALAAVPEVAAVSATVAEAPGGVPLHARVDITASRPGDAVVVAVYDTALALKASLPPGQSSLLLPPLSPRGAPLARVDVRGPGGGLLASAVPRRASVGAEVEQARVDTGDFPESGAMFSTDGSVHAVSPVISGTSRSAWFWRVKGDSVYSSFLVLRRDGQYAYGSGGSLEASVGTPYVYFIMPASRAAAAAAAAAWLPDVPGAVASLLSNLAGGILDAARAAATMLADFARVAWDGIQRAGAAAAHAAAEAWRWMTEAKIVDIRGPDNTAVFSVSVADALLWAATAAAPIAAAGLVARGAAAALSALGISGRALGAAARAAGAAAGGAVAYALARLEGTADPYALVAAVPAALSAVSPLAGMLAAVPVAASHLVRVQELPTHAESSARAQLALNVALNELCSDPLSAVLPLGRCAAAARAATVPVLRIAAVYPVDGTAITSRTITVEVENMSGVEGEAEVAALVDGMLSDRAALRVPGGGRATVQLGLRPGSRCSVVLLSGGVEVDRREYALALGAGPDALSGAARAVAAAAALAVAAGAVSLAADAIRE